MPTFNLKYALIMAGFFVAALLARDLDFMYGMYFFRLGVFGTVMTYIYTTCRNPD